jgi:hypothetical protein
MEREGFSRAIARLKASRYVFLPVISSAGRVMTDAAASVIVLTTETTPIDCSGGYDEVTSVP